ncbi:MAG: beta-propeller fold lactonase family protein [Pseudolysinimonas sp.]
MTDYLIGGYGPDMNGTGLGMLWGRSHADGRFEVGPLAAELDSPSWITVDGARVFAALEGAGALVELELSGERLLPVAHHIVGTWPCHVAVAHGLPIVACYGDGTIWTPAGALHGDAEHGPLPAQDGPHAHHVLVLGDTVLTLDLGTDRLYVHHVVDESLHRVDELALPPGTGPRDLLTLPDGRIALLGEWSCELLLLEPMGDTFEIVQIVALPGATQGADQASGLALSADGRFIVAGVRGSNRVATLEVGDAVAPVAWAPSGGDWPRHLVVDGEFVHVANQLSNTIASFRLGADGILTPVGEPVAAPSPTCLAPVGRAPKF